MPFGYDCEFVDFDACVAAQRAKGKTDEEARAVCGALQRDTKEDCVRKKILADVQGDERAVDLEPVEGGWKLTFDRPATHDLAKREECSRRYDEDGNRAEGE